MNSPTPYSVPAAANRIQYRKLLRCFMLLYLAFLFAVRTEWGEAMKVKYRQFFLANPIVNII